jgi:hypothetical protein
LLIKDLYFALYPLSSNALTQIKPAAAIGLFECKALLANGADTICRISVTLNLTFKRVPAAGSRSEWKTGIDAIPDDADAADTRAREPDPAVSNS